MTDPIVEEVRAARARIAEECDYDLARILDHARRATEKVPGLKYGIPRGLRTQPDHGTLPATTREERT